MGGGGKRWGSNAAYLGTHSPQPNSTWRPSTRNWVPSSDSAPGGRGGGGQPSGTLCMYELRAVVRTLYKITSDEWFDGPLQPASRAVVGGSRKTYLSAPKQFMKRSQRSATIHSTLNESLSVFARRKRGRSCAAILFASLRLLEKLEPPPPPGRQTNAVATIHCHRHCHST